MATSDDYFQRAADLEDAPVNYGALKNVNTARKSAADRAFLLALAASQAGDEFKPMAAHFLRNANFDEAKAQGVSGFDEAGDAVQDPGYTRQQALKGAYGRGDAADRRESRDAALAQAATLKREEMAQRGERDAGQREDRAAQRALTAAIAGQRAAGKPDLVAQRTATQRQADANDALGLLDQAAPLLDSATSSGMGHMRDATGAFFGASTKGADDAAKLASIGGMLVSKMPKMSGPQSDKDVMLYKEMAGKLGDPTVPASQKRAASQAIREIQQRYLGNETGGRGAEGGWDGAPAGGPRPGTVEGGYVFRGGDPANKANWTKR